MRILQRCATQAQTTKPPRYVALSYVWGDPQVHQTTKANRAHLGHPGNLVEDGFVPPRTVRDAMLLTEMIGVQYLWVDSLCIIQDDEEFKIEQINAIDQIYNCATLTMIAAHDSNANAELPGVSQTTRKWRHRIMDGDS
jgi:hypothetical protein